MHAWTTVTDAPVWQGIARAETGKDLRLAGDGRFPGFRRRLWATTTVLNWADGTASSTGLCPKLLGVADDDGRRWPTTRMAAADDVK